MKDKLLKRKEELTKEYNTLEKERIQIVTRLQEIEPKEVLLKGAYQEIEKLLLEEENANTTGNKD